MERVSDVVRARLPAIFTADRVWSADELTTHRHVRIAFEALTLTPHGAAEPVVVPMMAVQWVSLAPSRNRMDVRYEKDGVFTRTEVIGFANGAAADGAFQAMWDRLGDGFTPTRASTEWWDTVRRPLKVLAGVVIVTLILALLTDVLQVFAVARTGKPVTTVGGFGPSLRIPKTPLDYALGWLTPQGAFAVGGVACTAVLGWLAVAVARREERLTLARR